MSKVVIEFQRSEVETSTFKFGDGTYTIGRDKGDVVARDAQVSSRHAQLVVKNGAVVYTDLGSTNGSFLADGQRLQVPYNLPLGGTIRLGACTLRFLNLEDSPALEKTVLQPRMSSVPPPVPVRVSRSIPPPPPISAFTQRAIPEPEEMGVHQNQGAFADFVDLLGWGYRMLRPRMVEAALPIAVVGIPLPLLIAFVGQMAMLIPGLGIAMALVISLLAFLASIPLSLAMVLLIYPPVARYSLALYLGQPISMKTAWARHKAKLGANVLTTFLSTLLGGLTLGILGFYIFQIPYVEGKRNFDVNFRSFAIFKSNWKRPLLTVIGTGIVFFVPMLIAGAILSLIPFLGPIVATLLQGAVMAVCFPFVCLLLSRIYFETRETVEGVDPRPAARNDTADN